MTFTQKKIKTIPIILLLLMSFNHAFAAKYYWVGGSGNWSDINHWRTNSGGTTFPGVVPGPIDDVFFDANSGFTANSKTVILDVPGNCHDITFTGSAVAPVFTQNSVSQTFNIYGSSVWQSGMPSINISNIYYRHTGEDKTISSNGVVTGSTNGVIYFEEENSLSLSDAFSVGGGLSHQAGTFNTNGNDVTIKLSFYGNNGTKARMLNLGSSNVYMQDTSSSFSTSSPNVTLNAGTSHIRFTDFINASNFPIRGLQPYSGQTFYNVSFGNTAVNGGGSLGGVHSGTVYFNRVEFKGDGAIFGDNQYKELILAPTKTYSLQANKTQTITMLFSANTPQCGGWSTISSSVAGTQANIVAASGVTINVSGAIMKDLKASGGATFTSANSVDNGNNTGWSFLSNSVQNLYWVGGSGNWNDKAHWSQTSGGAGGYCVPGPRNNTFFDAGSGFTASNRTVMVDNVSYTHDITFTGSAVAPVFTQNSVSQTFNIYGSSVWQSGMPSINISNIYYRHTGEDKTISSNGVVTGSTNGVIYFEEENSLSLSDAFSVGGGLSHQAGTFSTNGNDVTIKLSFYGNNGTKARMLNLGSSNVYMQDTSSSFSTSSPNVTLNAGTSHIRFTDFINASNFPIRGLQPYSGQTFYNVSFGNTAVNGGGSLGGVHSGTVYFNRVEFKGDGAIFGDNQYKELIFSSGKAYTLQVNKTQTIGDWFLGGTPCAVTYITSNSTGTRANINITGGNRDFNFGNLKDINASGQTFHFGAQSTIANQNNNNITYDPYNAGSFEGLGEDWRCHYIDSEDPSTYTLKTSSFYGNINTKYSWYKLNDSNYNMIIGTASTLDIRPFGYGAYKVEVTYTDGASTICVVSDEINIIKKTDDLTANSTVCIKTTNTLADISVSGNNVKWYSSSSSTIELPLDTIITAGTTYYATQTSDSCESRRTAVTVVFVSCNNIPSMINPALPVRTR
ncbi:hypothetical protein [Chryseobacterium sp. Bi04]|uniref:hypothetical protein n=1 Tax=Chryseobacterium sp. Bi04 TaxID=2822345 RepID=UPI001DB5D144|nr:hypothetical protein [Chryseobacterium sp. Bi04]CAH0193512.1 hypothetical protein SRABI04_01798 [Chryseobacterium sp. Bi04]